ncbi:MAG: YfjI family protein [Bryobacteraceae bacterium]
MKLRSDPKEIDRALAVLFQPGDVVEMRVPKTEQEGTVSGYFTDHAVLVKALAARNGDGGVYVTINPCSPSLLARCANRIRSRARTTTSDKDIARRRWLLIDLDAARPAEISSTDSEHAAALERARDIRMVLGEEGWPAPVLADSGNGAHLLFCIDLPNDEAAAKLIEAVLKALAARFNDSAVQVDVTVFNAARIVKAYGTVARKGDDLSERPHRLSRIIDAPSNLEAVPRELLEEIAATAPRPAPPRNTDARMGRFDLEAFLARHLSAPEPVPYEGGRKWVLFECPFNPEHKAPDSAVFERANGSLAFKCFHNSCSGYGWRDVRELFDGPRVKAAAWAIAADCPTADWPELSRIGPELPPVKPFRASMLPEAFRSAVEDVAERMQVPLDFPAAAAIVCLAGAVNRRSRIQPKRTDATWRVVPNLWGGIVAPPGFLKSPVLHAMTAPLYAIERLWRVEHEAALEGFEDEKETVELRLAAWKEEAKKAFKKGATAPIRPDVSLTKPTMRRLIIGDSTAEKLHEIMAENPAGLLVVRDELTGWWAQLDRTGREGERAFCLQAWNGDTSHTIDRIGRGSVFVPACCMSMLGGITPGRLRSYLVDALKDGPTNDGLIQRFQILVWPDAPPEWRYVDQLPAENRMGEVFQRLTAMDLDEPLTFKFDDRAQGFFQEWLGCLEARIRRDDLHPALTSHLGKMRKTMPALCLLLTLGDAQESPVDLAHAEMAADWCEYLESQANRVYACVVSPRMKAAADLAEKLRKGVIGKEGSVTRRDIYRNCWSGLDTPESAGDALKVLEDAGWVRPADDQSGAFGGRPMDRWLVNPKVKQGTIV